MWVNSPPGSGGILLLFNARMQGLSGTDIHDQ